MRVRTGSLTIPSALAGVIVGVHGLDTRPQASAHFRAVRQANAATAAFTPPQLATLYDFPSAANGAGQTIALIELGGGYTAADLDTFFGGLGIATPSVTAVGVDGASNTPAGDPNSADGEVLLDIEVAGALAPAAKIVVYFAPNTDAGFLDAITTAIHDTTHAPTIVSISWGGAESTWTQQSLTNYDAALADAATLGVTVTVAAGDNGSTDGVTDGKSHVDFPASSPHVLACGGTSLTASGTTIGAETVWNDGASGGATGGGISDTFALPAWQTNAHVPPSANAGGHIGRGLPDVAGDADPQTGYSVVVDGQKSVFGGTSAVAPLWAGLIARLNELNGKPLGFINPALYANPSALRDITSGTNGAYTAGAGWDACTGLGSPNGASLATALKV
jgi:kumamolisin